jgi:hypothetical protein
MASDNLNNLGLRAELVAVAQTSQRRTALPIKPEQNWPRNWTMVLPIPFVLTADLHARDIRLFSFLYPASPEN